MGKSPEAFRTISEVANELSVPKHVLRFWEGKFSHLKPMKRGGGRRYYRPEDVDLLKGIRRLLYEDGYTIKGVQRIFREQGPRYVMECWNAPGDDNDGPVVRNIPDLASEAARRAANPPVTLSGAALGRDTPEQDAPGHGLSQQQFDLVASALDEVEACRKILRGEDG